MDVGTESSSHVNPVRITPDYLARHRYVTANFQIHPLVYSVLAFEPVFVGQGSADLVDEYWELVANKGIHG